MNERPTGIVLAGGKSSRFGGDKALAELDGRTLLHRAVNLLSKLCKDIIIVGRSEVDFTDESIKAVDDMMPGLGPISGLHTGLANSETEMNLVLAVDMPFATVALFESLLNSIGQATAAVPESEGRMQPLCAVYRKSCLPLLEGYIRQGRRAVFGFLDHTDYCRVHTEDGEILSDIDTPEQWQAAENRIKEK